MPRRGKRDWPGPRLGAPLPRASRRGRSQTGPYTPAMVRRAGLGPAPTTSPQQIQIYRHVRKGASRCTLLRNTSPCGRFVKRPYRIPIASTNPNLAVWPEHSTSRLRRVDCRVAALLPMTKQGGHSFAVFCIFCPLSNSSFLIPHKPQLNKTGRAGALAAPDTPMPRKKDRVRNPDAVF